jgi:hypothetical protein
MTASTGRSSATHQKDPTLGRVRHRDGAGLDQTSPRFRKRHEAITPKKGGYVRRKKIRRISFGPDVGLDLEGRSEDENL